PTSPDAAGRGVRRDWCGYSLSWLSYPVPSLTLGAIRLNDCTKTPSSSIAPRIRLRGHAAHQAFLLPLCRLFAALRRPDNGTPCADRALRSPLPPDALSSARAPLARSTLSSGWYRRRSGAAPG